MHAQIGWMQSWILTTTIANVWKVRPAGNTRLIFLETIPKYVPTLTTPPGNCRTEYRSTTDQIGPQMGPPKGLCPSPGQLMHPSDSIIKIWRCMAQTKHPAMLCTGSEGFLWFWTSELSGSLNVLLWKLCPK
jgi:hypothetical protein